MPATLKVYPVGTKVLLGEDIPAEIVRISLSGIGHNISYECEWWSGREHKTGWFYHHQVSALSGTKMLNVGFHARTQDEDS
jgi:uncharacterized protein YodC (DUF2158 family)